MSRLPTGICVCSIWLMTLAMRCAKGKPRRRMPTSARPSTPLFFSITSWARRTRVRWISEADISKSLSAIGDDSGFACELIAELTSDQARLFERSCILRAAHQGQQVEALSGSPLPKSERSEGPQRLIEATPDRKPATGAPYEDCLFPP